MGEAVEQEACLEIVRRINQEASGRRRAFCKTFVFYVNADGRIEGVDARGELDSFLCAGIGLCKLYLPLQVGALHPVVIPKLDMADTGSGKVEGRRTAKSACAYDGNRCGPQLCNAWTADFPEQDVPAVPVKIFRRKAHDCPLSAVEESGFSRTRI